jgi:aryl-alcohol dehydrogenase-like predicted oxidoreductase
MSKKRGMDMNYRKLGRSGLKVSEISLGSWISCDNLEQKQTSFDIIDKAYSLGINFFDTANAYSGGRAETILGEALQKYPRSSYVLATKVFWPMGQGPNERGLSRKHIFDQVHASLKRLDTDYIDVYYCHWFDSETPLEETLRAMDDLVRQGKVLYVGVSNWTAAQISEGLRVSDHYMLDRIVANQPSYNMFDRYIEKESIPFCEKSGIGQVVYSPLAQGVLTGKYRRGMALPEGSRAANTGVRAEVMVSDYLTLEILGAVEELLLIAGDMNVKLSQLALAWVLRKQNVASALIGASRPEQVEDNVKASGLQLSAAVLDKIEEILSTIKHPVKHNIVYL